MSDLEFWEKRLVALRKRVALFPVVDRRRIGMRHRNTLDAYQGVLGAYQGVLGLVAELRHGQ